MAYGSNKPTSNVDDNGTSSGKGYTNIDQVGTGPCPYEGTDDSLPPAEYNPVYGSDGKLPTQKITKIKE